MTTPLRRPDFTRADLAMVDKIPVPDPARFYRDFINACVAKATAAYKAGKKAAELTTEEKAGILVAADVAFKFEDGQFVTVCQVGITDDGRGGYFVAADDRPPKGQLIRIEHLPAPHRPTPGSWWP